MAKICSAWTYSIRRKRMAENAGSKNRAIEHVSKREHMSACWMETNFHCCGVAAAATVISRLYAVLGALKQCTLANSSYTKHTVMKCHFFIYG